MQLDRRFRDIMGHFATGVAVVTASSAQHGRAGVTINSFASLSLSPQLVLFSLDRSLLSLAAFEAAEDYGLSFLGHDQQELSRRFSARGADKWCDAGFSARADGPILLEGAIAHVECARREILDAGDHRLFICEVSSFEIGQPKRPLLYFKGRYRSLEPEIDSETQPQ